MLPDDGKRKKRRSADTIHAIYRCDGFEQIKAAVLFVLIRNATLTLARLALHIEGATMKQRAFRQNTTGYVPSKKPVLGYGDKRP